MPVSAASKFHAVLNKAKADGITLNKDTVAFTLGYLEGMATDSKSQVPQRTCGNSSLTVSTVSFGCWQLGSKGSEDYWQLEYTQDMANKMVGLAASKGVTYFDTAADYAAGASETQLGVALKTLKAPLQSRLVIGSKIVPNNCGNVTKHCQDTLDRLQIPSLDLYMVHWPIDENGMAHFVSHKKTLAGGRDYAALGAVKKEDVPSTAGAFRELAQLQKDGKVKHIGVSNFGVQQLKEALATGVTLAVNQICYNLIFRAAEMEVIPFCLKHGIGIIGYSPLMQGLLTGRWTEPDSVPIYRARSRHFCGKRPKSRHGEAGHESILFDTLKRIKAVSVESGISMIDIALAWPLHNPAVASVVVGMTKESHVSSNISASKTVLPLAVLAALDKATLELKTAMGPNMDLWQGGSDSRCK